MTWTNADGLVVFLAGESRHFNGGQVADCNSGTLEFELDLTTVPTTNTKQAAPFVVFPRNVVIEQVELVTLTAAAGGTSFDVGLQRLDNTTELDYDGLVAALPLASVNAVGKKVQLNTGTTYAGALVGTETVYPGYLTAKRVGTFTAGKILVRVRYFVKDADLNPDSF